MLSLHTNASALSAQNSLGNTQKALSTSMTRLSTGFRINSAADDAAGLQIATRLKAQTSGMAVAMRNTQNSVSMLQTADGAFDEVSNMLVRMKDLATQAADASSSAADKFAMQSEYNALGSEIGNVIKNTSFGGSQLFKTEAVAANGTGGTFTKALTFQIGASASEKMDVDIKASMLALNGSLVTVSNSYAAAAGDTAQIAAAATQTAAIATDAGLPTPTGTLQELTKVNGNAGAGTAITNLDTALTNLSTIRSALGAASNRLDHVYNNLSSMSTNTQAATGRIMDVDFASESASMTSKQMLMQAGTAMLKQSNSMSSMVMSLLQ
jgi:flagellin